MGPAVMILGVVLMVVIHEAAHFVAAKRFGMKATEAFFGFGPRLWSMRRGETEYGLKALPLGGYVRIIGMNPFEEVAPEDEGRTYRERPFWQKAIVVLAGIVSHFVIAFLIFYGLAVGYGSVESSLTVDAVADTLVVPTETDDPVPFEPEPDDEVVSVGGVPVEEIDPTTRHDGELVDVVVERDGRTLSIPTTDTVVPSPASLTDLRSGDRIVAVDGEPVETWEQFVDITHGLAGEETAITVDRDGEEIDFTPVLASRPFAGDEVGFLGVSPVLGSHRAGAAEGAVIAGGDLVEATRASVAGLAGFVTNFGSILSATVEGDDAALDEVRPVSAIGLTRVADSVEIALALLAWVNVFVGMLNVVPLYPLDGGHFAVALYERVRGRPADIRKLLPVAAAVFAFIVLLGLLGVYFDIVNPIELPG